MNGWIGVDLDGTLAEYHGWVDETHIGSPIQPMIERVRQWLGNGHQVKIFTARVSGDRDVDLIRSSIQEWCQTHIGYRLEVTCIKDYGMIELWDDRAVRVLPNQGVPCCTTELTEEEVYG